MEQPVIAPSARKHGLENLDEGLTTLVGPDHAGNLYDVGMVASNEDPVIVHACLPGLCT